MNARRALAGVVLALAAVASVAPPASAQVPPLPYEKYPVLVTSGLIGFDLYMEPLAVRINQQNNNQTYLWSPPELGLGDITAAGKSFGKKIADLQAKYDGRQIDVVAYGVGGLAARYYIEKLGGGPNINSLVMMGTPNQGTKVADLAQSVSLGFCGRFLPVCDEVATGSAFLKDLNSDPNLGGVVYTNIVSVQDELVIPHTNAFMPQQSNLITNLVIQDQCPNTFVESLTYPFNGVTYTGIQNALWGTKPVLFDCGAL